MAEQLVVSEQSSDQEGDTSETTEPQESFNNSRSSSPGVKAVQETLEENLSMSSNESDHERFVSNGEPPVETSAEQPPTQSVSDSVVASSPGVSTGCSSQDDRSNTTQVERTDGGCVSKSTASSPSTPMSTKPLKDALGRSLSLPPTLNENPSSKRKGSILQLKKGKKSGHNSPLVTKHRHITLKRLEDHYLDRPDNLPPKNKKEEKKHRKEVEKMLKKVEKAERKEFQVEKKKWEKEDAVADHQLSWKEDILPNWEKKHTSKEVRRLWEKGLPPSIRGQVWMKAIGNKQTVSHDMFVKYVEQCHQKLKGGYSEDTASVQAIQLDILRTFPTLGFFQKGCLMHHQLHDVLGAYACYRPDVGYVQGMSFLAAVLLLNMDSSEAFVCLCNLLAQPCYSVFFRIDRDLMQPYFDVFNHYFKEEVKSVYAHFEILGLLPHYYLMEWIITLYTKCLPLDVACRVWDMFCRDGESFLFRVALGLLRMHKSKILELEGLEDCGRFLSKFSDDISVDKLFKYTFSIELTEKRFQQRLQQTLHPLQEANQPLPK